jgi:copper transport protein
VALIALAAAPAAFAHATLASTNPADGSVLKRAPARVSLRFDEHVSTPFGAARVLDADGKRVDNGRETQPRADTVAVGLPAVLPNGTYVVAWRVSSADTHPVHGAFTFSIGRPDANANGIAAGVLAGEATPRSVSLGFGVVRVLRFVLVLFAAGGALLLALSQLGRPVERVIAACALATVPVAALGLVFEGAAAGGFSIAGAAKWSVFDTVLHTQFGEVWALQAGLGVLLAAAILLRRRYLGAAVGLVLAGATTAAAHASAAGSLAIVADGAHVIAAAAWTGGLAATALALVTARDERWKVAGRVVPRFSALATVAVAVLIVAGVTSAYLEVRVWRGLWQTTYGQLVLVKVVLLLPLLALGVFNNRVAVPGLRLEVNAVRRRFVRAAAFELVLIACILGVTAALVQEPPARAQVGSSGPFGTTSRLGPYELDVTVDPARTGPNDVHLYVLRASGQPANGAEAHVFASLPSAALGPIRFQAAIAGPGHFVINEARLPIPGRWSFQIEIRFGSFDQYDTTIVIPIAKGTP